MKNMLYIFNSRLDLAEKMINELKDINMLTIFCQSMLPNGIEQLLLQVLRLYALLSLKYKICLILNSPTLSYSDCNGF